MKHLRLKDAKAKLCEQAGLLGEPCDPATLIQHYGKPGSRIHTDTEMDFKSESAAIYVLVVATLYLVMVAVMVGLNYRLRGRHLQVKQKESGEVEEVEDEERRGVSVSFTEGRAPYSSLVGRLSGEGRGMDSTRVDL